MLRTRGAREILPLHDVYIQDTPPFQVPLSWEVFLESLNEHQVRITINGTVTTEEISDLTGTTFHLPLTITDYVVIYSAHPQDDELLLDGEKQRLDLQPALYHAVMFQRPLTLLAPGEQKDYDQLAQDPDEVTGHKAQRS